MFYNYRPTFYIITEDYYLPTLNTLNTRKIPGVHLPTENCAGHSCTQAVSRVFSKKRGT